jgi:1-acyl-sn-glycerol-3-phosphate acyltransferase
LALRALLRWRYALVVEGELPAGAVVIVANHSSHLDTAAVLAALGGHPTPLRVAAAQDYFFRNRVIGAAAASLLGAFPFPREGGCRAGLRRSRTFVEEGESVLVFPEGTRAAAGAACRFKPGVGLIARGGVAVLPLGIAGTGAAMPKGARFAARGRIAVVIGRPLSFDTGVAPGVAAAAMEASVNQLVVRAEALRGQLPNQLPSAQARSTAVSWPARTSVPPTSSSARRIRSIPR